MKKKIEIIFCVLFLIVSIISLFIGVGEVSEILNGWRGFSSGYAAVFVIICLLFASGRIFNAIGFLKDKISSTNFLIALCL